MTGTGTLADLQPGDRIVALDGVEVGPRETWTVTTTLGPVRPGGPDGVRVTPGHLTYKDWALYPRDVHTVRYERP